MADLIYQITSASVLVPAIVGTLTFSKQKTRFRWMIVLVMFGLTVEILSLTVFTRDNRFLGNIYFTTEFLILGLILRSIVDNRIWKKALIFLISIVFIMSWFNLLVLHDFYQFNSFNQSCQAIVLIVISMLSFVYMLNHDQLNWQQPESWFILAVLIYLSGSFFSYGLLELNILNPENFKFDVWYVHAIFNIFYNLLFAVTLWVGWKRAKTEGI